MPKPLFYARMLSRRLVCCSTPPSPQFPDGLANSSGWVGRAIMIHSSNDVYAKFEQEVRLYKGTPVLASTQDLSTKRILGAAMLAAIRFTLTVLDLSIWL